MKNPSSQERTTAVFWHGFTCTTVMRVSVVFVRCGHHHIKQCSVGSHVTLPTIKKYNLKGHCHGDFAACWSKLFKYLTKNLFSYLKLFLGHRKENVK